MRSERFIPWLPARTPSNLVQLPGVADTRPPPVSEPFQPWTVSKPLFDHARLLLAANCTGLLAQFVTRFTSRGNGITMNLPVLGFTFVLAICQRELKV